MLVTLGGAIQGVWRESPEDPAPGSTDNTLPTDKKTAAMILAAGMAAVGAYLAVQATIQGSTISRLASAGTLAATVISPLLVLPTISGCSTLAHRGHASRAVTSLVGTVLLNLCVLLPLAILCWYIVDWRLRPAGDIRPIFDATRALPYAMATWRIENVLLVVLGFVLVPIALGRWVMSQTESMLLVLGYAIYVLTVALSGLQL